MAFFNPLSKAFGLDIGDRTFKVAQIAKVRRTKMPYRLTAWGSIAVPEGVMERGEVQDMAAAADFVNQLIGQTKGLKGRGVVACLPEAKSFVKLVEIEKGLNDKDVQALVAREIEQNIPLKFDEIYYDWQQVEDAPAPKPEARSQEPAADKEEDEGRTEEAADRENGEEETPAEAQGEAEERTNGADEEEKEPAAEPPPAVPGDRTRVLIAAAPKNIIDGYSQMLEMAGLAPLAFEIEAVAIARAIVPIDESFFDPIGILDIGATRSSLVIYDEGVLQMSISIPISGYELTKMIGEKLGISHDDAELVKVECGLDANRCEDRMWKILLPVIDDMSAKIRNALRFYKIGFALGKKIERLYLCGGGAHFREIDTVLSRKLTIKVRRGDALVNIRKPKTFQDDKSLTYTTAIGLALRAADESEKYRGSFLHI